MSAIFLAATLVAAGTSQKITATLPALPTLSMGGITYPAGSATVRAMQLVLQADPANTGTNIYIGGKGLVKGTRVNCGAVLAKGVSISLGQLDGSFALDDIYFDGDTTGDKLLMSLVG
jgi:hypothetical protein